MHTCLQYWTNHAENWISLGYMTIENIWEGDMCKSVCLGNEMRQRLQLPVCLYTCTRHRSSRYFTEDHDGTRIRSRLTGKSCTVSNLLYVVIRCVTSDVYTALAYVLIGGYWRLGVQWRALWFCAFISGFIYTARTMGGKSEGKLQRVYNLRRPS